MARVRLLVAAAGGARVLLALGSLTTVARALPAPQLPPAAGRPVDFVADVQPILVARCTECHGANKQKGGYRLDDRVTALHGGDEHAPNIVPGDSAASPLIRFVAGGDPDIKMPNKGEPLTAAEIGVLRAWIDQGANWPDSASAGRQDPRDWWSLQPLVRPAVPGTGDATRAGGNPIDAFIASKLREHQLTPALPADRGTLIRRLYFDLIGLPPAPADADVFVADPDPQAYEQLVDRLLAASQYGERWARHWLDVVHFGETHGYDKDQPRPHAWPYRDYVIRACNSDKPYRQFVQEQLAGDVLFPDTQDGVEALGFLAAGPWDLLGHAEVPETKIDGKVARHLDRDDMVSNAINTFCSLTVHCAQCHNHKFDPILQADYYSLQAVFAALDRADKPYDVDPAIRQRRSTLAASQRQRRAQQAALDVRVLQLGGQQLADLDQRIAAAKAVNSERPQYGYHSAIAALQATDKWVQVDLGRSVAIDKVVLAPCHDDCNGIGDGFGFPLRFRVECSDDPDFAAAPVPIVVATAVDQPRPGIAPQSFAAAGKVGRYVRVTATRLAPRQDDFIFALAELEVLDAAGNNLAAGAPVTAQDSIEMPPRWARGNLVDGVFPAGNASSSGDAAGTTLAALTEQRAALVVRTTDAALRADIAANAAALADVMAELARLPPSHLVYAGTVYHGTGSFVGTGGNGGKPRPVFVLARGDVTRPGAEVVPGAIAAITALPGRFALAADAPEGERRAALAHWVTDVANPLTWRSIVNRVWQYHFGRGLVDSPNDFGHMGQLPSHPQLLDWLACWFRDGGGSLKQLHRLIVTSATYRQSSAGDAANAAIDAGNVFLWHMPRRKLEAEAVRDSLLASAGVLDLQLGGPSFQDFVITHPENSPHYHYELADADSPLTWRRSIYRFIVRSQQQPFMAALDCADPSMLVDKRNQTLTPLQALAQLNDQLTVVMSKHFAARVDALAADLPAKITAAFRLALVRAPQPDELAALVAYARQYGLANTCRLITNLNEFVFVD